MCIRDSAEAGGSEAADVPSQASYSSDEPADAGTLASDEALAALREKLAGN